MSKNYAIVDNGVVVNIAVSEEALDSNWIQSDVAQIGWTYENGEFIAPPAPPVVDPPPPPKTEEEKLAEATAAAIAKLIADGVLKQA